MSLQLALCCALLVVTRVRGLRLPRGHPPPSPGAAVGCGAEGLGPFTSPRTGTSFWEESFPNPESLKQGG